MTGKGWTWLGSDGAVSSTFTRSQHLQHAMQGMVGFRPKSGSGELFSSMLKQWTLKAKKDKVSVKIKTMFKRIKRIHSVIGTSR